MAEGDIVKYLMIFLISFLPIAEVRGSIPMVFVFFKDTTSTVCGLTIAVIGNLMIAPIMLTVLKRLDIFIMNSRAIPGIVKRVYVGIMRYAHSKASKINRYSLIGLMIFVAIPLPGTGAWTGSLIAYILGIDRRKALVAIELGVLGASLIVSLASILGIELIKRLFML